MKRPSHDSIKKSVGVVIPAAGSGSRFGEEKQFRSLGGRAVLFHSLAVFLELDQVLEIAVVVPDENVTHITREIRSFTQTDKIVVVPGGKRRQDSVQAGLSAISENCNIICIHDAARPFLTTDMVLKTVNACDEWDGAIVATPVADTLKKVDHNSNGIISTQDRSDLWCAQTPQSFRRERLSDALINADNKEITATDEAMLLERLGYRICVVPGNAENIKITQPEDWILAEAILRTKK